jgi:hypothetical protein
LPSFRQGAVIAELCVSAFLLGCGRVYMVSKPGRYR